MSDIATLGLQVKTDGLATAKVRLDQLALSADKLANAISRVEGVAASANASMRRLDQSANNAAGALRGAAEEAKNASSNFSKVSERAAGITDALSSAGERLSHFAEAAGTASAQSGEASGGVSGLGASVGGLINPAALASTAVTVLTEVVSRAAVAARDYAMAQDNLSLSLMGVGEQTGLTTYQLGLLAEENARSANISISSAREQAAEYARMGIQSSDVIGKMIEISRRYALVTGQDMPSANKELAASIADPIKGVETMIDRVGGIDGKTRDYIISLAQSNDMMAAQATLLGKVAGRVRQSEGDVTNLTKILNAGTVAWQDFWSAAGKRISLSFEPEGTAFKDAEIIKNWDTYHGRSIGFGLTRIRNASKEEYAAAMQREALRKADAEAKKILENKNTVDLAGDRAYAALVPDDERLEQLKAHLNDVKADHDQGTRSAESYNKARAAYNKQVAEINGTHEAYRATRSKNHPIGEVARQTACKCANDEAKRAKAFEIVKQPDIEAEGPITQLAIDAKEVEAVLTDTMANIPSIVAPARSELSALAEDIAKSFGQAIASGQDLGDALSNTFRQIAASYVTQGIKDIFASMGNIGKTGSTGSASAAGGGGDIWSTIFSGFSSLFSWDGGGYTGDGSRSGGVDGKGGFLAVMHPRETVIDHTKGGRGGGGQAVQVAVSVTVDDDGKIKAYVRDSSARAVQTGLSRYDAGMPQRVAAITNDPRRR